MSHDKLVNYIDVNLKDVLEDNVREELLALHYAAIHNARTAGIQEGVREQQAVEGDVPDNTPPEPEGPPNQIIGFPPFPAPLKWLVIFSVAAIVILSAVAIIGNQ